MISTDLLAIAVFVATLLGALGVLGQVVVTRSQSKLQEAAAYSEQARAWQAIGDHWQNAVLVGYGPDTARQFGLDATKCQDYAALLEGYRQARFKYHEALMEMDRGGDLDDQVIDSLTTREADLAPYRESVRLILVHLAQLSDLLLRRRLREGVVYDALGHDLLRDSAAVDVITSLPYDGGGHPGPMHDEIAGWRSLSLDEVSVRIGWASSLSESAGPASRIRVLRDALTLYSEFIGDALWRGPETAGHQVVEPRNMGFRWKTVASISVYEALRFCWKASFVSIQRWSDRLIMRALFRLASMATRPLRFIRLTASAIRVSATVGYFDEIHLKRIGNERREA